MKTFCFSSLILQLLVVGTISLQRQQGSFNAGVSWYETTLLEYPALRTELDLTITFPDENRPILMILPWIKFRYDFRKKECFSDIILEGLAHHFRNTYYFLPVNSQDGVSCSFDGYHTCNISVTILYHEPTKGDLLMGYICNERKNLNGVMFEYTVDAQNTTQCERMETPHNADKNLQFQCDKFYNYVTLPNTFGHISQPDAIAFIQMFQISLGRMEPPCHQHVQYILCQAILPRCPEEIVHNNFTALTQTVICEKMFWEFYNACLDDLQPIINFYDCSYYNQLTMPGKHCIYMPVKCDLPPIVEHSSIVKGTKKEYVAGDSVRYKCKEGYTMIGNDTSKCKYSGAWSHPPKCKSMLPIKTICATLAIVAFSFLLLGIKWRRRLVQNELNLNRNREFDAFVSYTYGASIDFAKGFLHRELEVEATPPFRLLFHTRDFHAATLILVNIIEAVRKSNCAIILMCQEYIDSGWCREEFQVTNIQHSSIIASNYIFTAHQRSCGKVMFSQAPVCSQRGRVSTWSHVPSGGLGYLLSHVPSRG